MSGLLFWRWNYFIFALQFRNLNDYVNMIFVVFRKFLIDLGENKRNLQVYAGQTHLIFLSPQYAVLNFITIILKLK